MKLNYTFFPGIIYLCEPKKIILKKRHKRIVQLHRRFVLARLHQVS